MSEHGVLQRDETLTILSPAPTRVRERKQPARRAAGIDGRRIALLDNNKPGATAILERLGDRLREQGATEVRRWRKALPSGPSPYVGDAGEQADIVLSGVGDCGSCSSWSLRDALDVELLGRPTVTLVSAPFAELVRIEAEALGMPDLRILTVPHPIATLPEADLHAIADDLFDRVIASVVERDA